MSSQMNSTKSLGPFFSGAPHLLSSPEDIEMASIVYDLSLEEISLSYEIRNPSNVSSTTDDEESKEDQDPRIEVSRKNLKRIHKLFQDASDARTKFVNNFRTWQVLREENISQLDDLISLIREEKKKCSIGMLVGGAASLIGGAAVTGALLFPPAAPALLPAAVSAYLPAALLPAATAAAAYLPSFLLPAAAAAPAAATGVMAGGLAAAGLGGATAAGSVAALLALREKRLEEAREVIKADELAFDTFMEWFKHTQGLIEATEELLGFDVIEGWVKDLNTAFSWCMNDDGKLLKRPDLFKAGIKLCLLRILPHIGAVLPGFGTVFLASLLTFVFCLFWLKHRSIFHLIGRMRSMAGRLGDLNPQDLGMLGAAGAQVFALWSRRGATFGAFAALGLVSSAAFVVLSSLDLKEEGNGKSAEPVEKVVEKLREELGILEEVYDDLVSV